MDKCCGNEVVETRAVQEPFLPDGFVMRYTWETCLTCGKTWLLEVEDITEGESVPPGRERPA